MEEEEKALEARWGGMTETIVDLEEQMIKIKKKSKKPSLIKRFFQLFSEVKDNLPPYSSSKLHPTSYLQLPLPLTPFTLLLSQPSVERGSLFE